MGMTRASVPVLAVTLALGAGLGAVATMLAGGEGGQCREPDRSAQAARIAELEAELARRPAAFASPAAPGAGGASRGGQSRSAAAPRYPDASRTDVDQLLKDLLTLAWNDRRGFGEKVSDFLSEHPDQAGIAIASKGVFDLRDNPDVLPDAQLQSMYRDQDDPALKRVLAQVASMRGDNSLIERHVSQAVVDLRSTDPVERQQALAALARTRHVAAADLAAPLLGDPDTGVVLDALLALRASGNQRHVRLVEGLLDHPDEAVAWLAMDVITDLQSLSGSARTRVAADELAAELPPLPMPDAIAASDCSLARG